MRLFGSLLKYLSVLAILGLAALVVYALVFDLPAPVREISRPLALPEDGG